MQPIFLLCWVGVGIWWHVVFWIACGGFAMDLKILTMDLRRAIRRYRHLWRSRWAGIGLEKAGKRPEGIIRMPHDTSVRMTARRCGGRVLSYMCARTHTEFLGVQPKPNARKLLHTNHWLASSHVSCGTLLP